MSSPRVVAPICHVAPQALPGKPALSPLPNIPPAVDLQSGLQAINQIRLALNIVYNQISQNNFSVQPSSGGTLPPGTQLSPIPFSLPASNFVEVAAKRIYRTTRVFGMTDGVKDPNVWVDVKQIVGLTFVDAITDQEWQWAQ